MINCGWHNSAIRQTLIQKLKEDITKGRVVIIAGTGVSIAACGNQLIENHPVASWPGLLQNGSNAGLFSRTDHHSTEADLLQECSK